jgi:hypothetical protein
MKIATTLGLGLALAATAGLMAVPAAATTPVAGDYISAGTNIRSGAHTTSSVNGIGYAGQGALIYCWVTGDDVSGDTTWLYNKDQATGVIGYSAEAVMTWSGGAGHC